DYRFQMHLLGRQERKPLLKIEAHLITKHRNCTGSGTVILPVAVRQHMSQQVLVDLHFIPSAVFGNILLDGIDVRIHDDETLWQTLQSHKVIRPFRWHTESFDNGIRSEEHTSELQSRENLVCR